jgi:tRNA threonylcarbamoyl adenosine modification protein (Sua5/YciO/YrdC/YwlC family)
MPSVFELREPEEAPLSAAAESLARGEAVVLPTDTVYGLAARPDDAAATDRLFRAKGRPRDLSLPVLAAGLEDARRVGSFPPTGERLAERFWPGALTVVVPRADAATSWELGSERTTVALRVPDHPVALALLRRAGPLAVTSANRSGRPTPEDCDGVRRELGDAVAVYLCAGRLSPVPSTIVDLSGPEPRLVRAGALDPDEVLGALR